MFTPQQIDQISFGKATFGGYNMQQVDEFLEPLTEDYVTLYKENALLKSKMRVLVGKLEEYRKNEKAMKESAASAQRTAEKMIKEAEAKCAQMMSQAQAAAQAMPKDVPVQVSAQNDALVAAESVRLEEARRTASTKISEIQDQMRSCIQALERIKSAAAPAAAASFAAPAAPAAPVAPAAPKQPASFSAPAVPASPAAPATPADNGSVADEIAHNVEALVGTTVDTAPKAEPRHPVNDTTTSRFANLNLQFGRNYDPTHK